MFSNSISSSYNPFQSLVSISSKSPIQLFDPNRFPVRRIRPPTLGSLPPQVASYRADANEGRRRPSLYGSFPPHFFPTRVTQHRVCPFCQKRCPAWVAWTFVHRYFSLAGRCMPHAGIISFALHPSGSFQPLELFGCYSQKTNPDPY